MGGVQSLSKGFIDEFTSFDGPSKVKGVKDLIKLTPYQHQLEILEYLRELLYKDFIACLPPSLAQKIICCLPFVDVLSSLLVNKKWNEVITHHCDTYWERFSKRLGLCLNTRSEVLRQQYGTLKSLCIAGFKQNNMIRALVPATVSVSKSHLMYSYVYAGNGVLLKYREINGTAEILVEKAKSPSCVVQVARFIVPSRSGRVKWAAASDRYLLWKQVDGKWIGCSTEEDDPELDQWEDEPAGEGFFSIAFCHRCHLVAMVADAEGDCEVWDVHVVKLQRGAINPRRMVYPVSLEHMKPPGEATARRFCLSGRITLVSECEARDSTGFCTTHRVLLQVGNCVAVHRLKSVSSQDYPVAVHAFLPDGRLSKPLGILTPYHHHPQDLNRQDRDSSADDSDDCAQDNLFYTQPTCGAVLCMSHDRSLLGMVCRGTLHVWNLQTCEKEACTKLAWQGHTPDMRCVAMGTVYAVLASDMCGVCAVVTTHGGQVIMEHSVGGPDFVPEKVVASRFSFYAPLCEEWLSAVGHIYSDLWPLALFFDWKSGSKEVEFKAVVGTPLCAQLTSS